MEFNVFFPLAGLILGTVMTVTIFPGAAWTVQVTLARNVFAGFAVGLGIAIAQFAWSSGAGFIIWGLDDHGRSLDWIVRAAAAFTLVYMALVLFQADRISFLRIDLKEEMSIFSLFYYTLFKALKMPMRLFAYLGMFFAVSLHVRTHELHEWLLLAGGVGAGSFLWWCYLTLLAAIFGDRVPEEITLRSMNKLKTLGGSVFIGLTLICVIAMLVKLGIDL